MDSNTNILQNIESTIKSLDTIKPDLASYMLDSMQHGSGQRHYICLEDALAAIDNAGKVYADHINTLIHALNECAVQTDCPVYEGDKAVDLYIRLSDVIGLIHAHLRPQSDK